MTTRARVLVIEDDDTLRETLAEVLVDEGHDVRVAAHGAQALEVIGDWQPEIVLLDLMMPVMDAYEFRERQRQLGAALDAKVVILSAARDIAAAASRLEADDWIAKPFGVLEVLDAVDRHLPAAS